MICCISAVSYRLRFNAHYCGLKNLLHMFYGLLVTFWLVLVGLQVSVSLSANESIPGDPVTLRVRGEKGSCVCVATVDKSLYLLKPDFQLSPDKVEFTVQLLGIHSWIGHSSDVVSFHNEIYVRIYWNIDLRAVNLKVSVTAFDLTNGLNSCIPQSCIVLTWMCFLCSGV